MTKIYYPAGFIYDIEKNTYFSSFFPVDKEIKHSSITIETNQKEAYILRLRRFLNLNDMNNITFDLTNNKVNINYEDIKLKYKNTIEKLTLENNFKMIEKLITQGVMLVDSEKYKKIIGTTKIKFLNIDKKNLDFNRNDVINIISKSIYYNENFSNSKHVNLIKDSLKSSFYEINKKIQKDFGVRKDFNFNDEFEKKFKNFLKNIEEDFNELIDNKKQITKDNKNNYVYNSFEP